jgi:RNA polymerase sigma factor (sigma-70 family)
MNRNLLQLVLRHADGLSAEADADALLLRRFVASRDEAAFALLVKRHGPMVWAVCRQSVPNHADADDAFQATFLALAQSAKSIRCPERLGGWLHASAVRIAGKAKRGFTRRAKHERATAKAESDSPVSAAAWSDLQAAVHAEVADLPPSLRAVFVLCDLEGVDHATAAKQLGLKPGTLSGQLARARQRLLAALTKRGLAAGAVSLCAGVSLPEVLANKVAGGVIPSAAVIQLASEITTMGVSKLKLLAAGLLVAGGLTLSGFGLLSKADGQDPKPVPGGLPPGGGPGTPPGIGPGTPVGPVGPGLPGAGGPGLGSPGLPPGSGGGPGGVGGGLTTAPAPGEFLFVGKPNTVADVAKVLKDKGSKGWDYTGPVDVDPADPPKGKEFEGISKSTRVVLVFKRKPGPVGWGPGVMGSGGGLGGGMTGGKGGSGGVGGGEGEAGGVEGGEVTMVYKLKHASATADLVGLVRTHYAASRGRKTSAGLAISGDVKNNSLVISGSQFVVDLARDIVDTLDVKPTGGEIAPGPGAMGGLPGEVATPKPAKVVGTWKTLELQSNGAEVVAKGVLAVYAKPMPEVVLVARGNDHVMVFAPTAEAHVAIAEMVKVLDEAIIKSEKPRR